MRFSEVRRATQLLDLGSFLRAAMTSTHYSDGVLVLKSGTQGSPEYRLPSEDKKILLDTMMAYVEDELEKLGIVPDPVEEAPEESA